MPIRRQASGADLNRYFRAWSRELADLRQNDLLTEQGFRFFARDRGIRVFDTCRWSPGALHLEGFLSIDHSMGEDLFFHPFRLHVLERSLSLGDRITPDLAKEWNTTADLAILLEPIYWPQMTGQRRSRIGAEDNSTRLADYRQRAIELVRGLDPDSWQKVHETLRVDAAALDPNLDLYLLLRLAPWQKRVRLRGGIAGALWIRHVAEVIRRGFEEGHGVRWSEEDEGFLGCADVRVREFGSERLYDDPLRSKPFVAHKFGLIRGSVLRWYVEGETEYYAIRHILKQPSKLGVELVNLHGEIANERRNAAFKLEDALKEDLALRRLSAISFDLDVSANVRAIRRQVEQGHVVGWIQASKPDFEFANFDLQELIEIVALKDGLDLCELRERDWSCVENGRAFAGRYTTAAGGAPTLKGEEWGRSLAEYAVNHPVNRRTKTPRPFLEMVWAAYGAWQLNYDVQKELVTIDPVTLRTGPASQSN